MSDRKKLVPVHKPSSGADAFQYDIVPFVLGGNRRASSRHETLPLVQSPTALLDNNPNDEKATPVEDSVEDFLSFGNSPVHGDPVEDAIVDAGQPTSTLVFPDAVQPASLSQPPWIAEIKGMSSPSLRLHREIVEMCYCLEPLPFEGAARQAALKRIQDVVCSIWPEATMDVFGSFATGLYLPSSDIDTVILNSGCSDVASGLKALGAALTRRGLARSVQVISKATVPIIKFEETKSGYNFDVSFDVANGPQAAACVRELMETLPPMRALTYTLKVFLQQRCLNEVYSGGIGSYALLVLVANFLQTHPCRCNAFVGGRGRTTDSSKDGKKDRTVGKWRSDAEPLESNLGCLLVDFFRFYGRTLQPASVGVSCRRGGFFFDKRARGYYQEDRPYLLAIEDPNDEKNDLGKNSYNISRVRMAFDHAYCRLTAPSAPGESLIARIIRLEQNLFCRTAPPGFNNIEGEGHKGRHVPGVVADTDRHVEVRGPRRDSSSKASRLKRPRKRERSMSVD